MENYSFHDHALEHFQMLMEHNGFTVDESPTRQLRNHQDDLILFISAKCKIQIFRERNKVFVEVAPLKLRTPNDWYPFYVVIAFLSNGKAEDWAWLLDFHENGFSFEAIESQLLKWHELVNENMKQAIYLFEESTFRKAENELSTFRANFYSKLSQLTHK